MLALEGDARGGRQTEGRDRWLAIYSLQVRVVKGVRANCIDSSESGSPDKTCDGQKPKNDTTDDAHDLLQPMQRIKELVLFRATPREKNQRAQTEETSEGQYH